MKIDLEHWFEYEKSCDDVNSFPPIAIADVLFELQNTLYAGTLHRTEIKLQVKHSRARKLPCS